MHLNVGMVALEESQIKYFEKNTVDEFYDIIGSVEKGKFSVIRKLVQKSTGLAYVAKHIKKQMMMVNLVPSIHHEIAVLQLCKSNGILGLHRVFETASHITLILDYMSGGDLQTFLDKKGILSETDAKHVVKQVLESIQVMHEQNIAYIDVKPANILLSKPNCFDGIKLGDFSVSRCLKPGQAVRLTSGTLDYMAPEIKKCDPISMKSDVWSIGVLAYDLLCVYPLGDKARQENYFEIKNGFVNFDEKVFDSISVCGMNFIKSAMILEPISRPSIDDLMQHVWITTSKKSL